MAAGADPTGPGPFALKSTEALILETSEERHKLRRVVGALDLTAIGVGAIIGTGIFVVIGVGAADAGPGVIAAFALAGLVCLFSALSYAELASSIPVAGSAYTYTYATLGEFVAWMVGWCLVLEYGVAVAAVAVGWGANLNSFLDTTFGVTMPHEIAASPADGGVFNVPVALIVVGVAALAILGVRETARATMVMVVVKIAVLMFFVVVALFAFDNANLTPFAPQGFDGVAAAAAILFFAYLGFDAVSTGTEEARRPSRDIPIATIGSLAIATVVYMLVSMTAVGLLPASALAESEAPLADALARGAGIEWASAVTAFGALVAITSVILAIFYALTRILFAIARDGLIPERLAEVNRRTRTPVMLTVAVAILVMLVAAFLPLGQIVELVNIGALFAFIVVNASVIILRRTRPGMPRPFKVPLSPVFPLVGIALCVYLALQLPATTWLRFVVWLVVGMLIYGVFGYRNSRLRRPAPQAMQPPTPGTSG